MASARAGAPPRALVLTAPRISLPIPPSLPSSSPRLALAAHSYVGKDARFQNKAELFGLVRERYLLFVKCVFGAQSARSAHVRLRACARRLCALEARGASVQR